MKNYIYKSCFLTNLLFLFTIIEISYGIDFSSAPDTVPPVQKIRDLVIYKNPKFYSTFPSVIKKDDGEIIVAFRRAPDRKIFGEKGSTHIDPNSYLVTVSSKNNAETWTQEPKLLYAHPFGGSQDPCLIHLKDGTLLCASYGWAIIRPDGIPYLKKPNSIRKNGEAFLGGYILRSTDGGENWRGPIYPPSIPDEVRYSPMGHILPAYNRGAMHQGKSGKIFWVVTGKKNVEPGNNSTHLLVSGDNGLSWEYSSPVAQDDKITFNETSVYETPKGDLVAFMRTADFEDQACIARSTDGGKSFAKWESMGFKGHPLQALRLPDDRVFLVYGYRHKPYGIRARILNAECTDFKSAEEIIIRDDGGSTDIGYPWSVMLDNNRILVTYYFNIENGTRYIAGSILEIN